MGAAAFVLNDTGIRGIRLDDAAEVSDGIAAALAHNGPGVVVLVCGAILIVLASRLRRSKETGRQAAHRLFVFSISYLFVLFAALLASNSGNRWSPVASARASPTAAAPLQAESLVRSVQAVPCPIRVRAGEV
jgi:heme o synthase